MTRGSDPVRLDSAVGVDLGTTAIKSGWRLLRHMLPGETVEAPPLRRDRLVVEGDPEAYAQAVERILEGVRRIHGPTIGLGLSSQRSSFLLWERSSGRPVTPLVSWMDRRAAPWCRAHAEIAADVEASTLLRFSPQYVGPKLAHLFAESPDLRRRADAGEVLFGNLDAWLLWRGTQGQVHETDLTMAARTLLVDPREGDWSPALLDLFGVPRRALPRIVPTTGRDVELTGGGRVRASVADQAAAVLGALGRSTGRVLVNLGTGAFVLRPLGERAARMPGFLVGPILRPAAGPVLWAAEGPVNGVARSWDDHGGPRASLPDEDVSPEAFALPETAGVGSPRWLPDVPFLLSPAAERLPAEILGRIVLEGIAFRVREVVDGLHRGDPVREVVATGGLTRSPALVAALSNVLDARVLAPADPEASVAGAAALAVGEPSEPDLREVARPGERGAYLREKYERWRAWVAEVLSAR